MVEKILKLLMTELKKLISIKLSLLEY